LYETRLRDELGLRKNTSKTTWQIIGQHIEKRKAEDKESRVYRNGLEISRKQLLRGIRRNRHCSHRNSVFPGNTSLAVQVHLANICVGDVAPLPEDITIRTPSPDGSRFRKDLSTHWPSLEFTEADFSEMSDSPIQRQIDMSSEGWLQVPSDFAFNNDPSKSHLTTVCTYSIAVTQDYDINSFFPLSSGDVATTEAPLDFDNACFQPSNTELETINGGKAYISILHLEEKFRPELERTPWNQLRCMLQNIGNPL
jgi:hypothetical protein